MRYMKIDEYSKEHILDAIRDLKDKYYYENNLFNDDECELYMNIDTYELLKRIAKLDYGLWIMERFIDEPRKIFDLEIKIDNEIEYLTFMIKESEKMEKGTEGIYTTTFSPAIRFGLSNIQYFHTYDTKLPKEYYINEKKKTVVLK